MFMMRTFFPAALGFTLAGSVECQADFVGLLVEEITANNDGLREFAIYAQFDDPTDKLLGVIDANITTTTGFFHNSIIGDQQSALPFTSAMTAMSDNPDADSFVTIGLFNGDGNETTLVPTFDVDAFLNGNSIGVDAGWFNFDPLNDQGVPDGRGLVLIAVFAPTNDLKGKSGVVSGVLTVGYSIGGPVPEFGTDSFITPAPGALGLLALAGVMGRRRGRAGDSSGAMHA
jgi:hypothetical protein